MTDNANENETNYINEKKSLLKKYDIPIDHLTFEYIDKCNNGKELENITKILRSGEEGYFPHLLECSVKRLTHVLPNSKVLRVEEPILTKSCLNKDQWNLMASDMQQWTDIMKSRELELQENKPIQPPILPAVRNPNPVMNKSNPTLQPQQNMQPKVKCVVPRDYAKWDKFDADSEILKLDIEEEREREESAKKQKEKEIKVKKKIQIVEKEDQNVISETVHGGRKTQCELQVLAETERVKGNECYREGDFLQAKRHYSASIAIYPTVAAWNNRAMTSMKLNMYGPALVDCDQVLAREPDNTKALLRRGTAHRNTYNLEKAREDFSKVVQLEPKNKFALDNLRAVEKLADKDKPKIKTKPNTGRDHSGVKIVELNSENIEPCPETSLKSFNKAVNVADKHKAGRTEKGSGEDSWGDKEWNILGVADPEKIPEESWTGSWETRGVTIEEITDPETTPETCVIRSNKTGNVPDVQEVMSTNKDHGDEAYSGRTAQTQRSLPQGTSKPIRVQVELRGAPDEPMFDDTENGSGDKDCSKDSIEVLPVYHPGEINRPVNVKADAFVFLDEREFVDRDVGRGDQYSGNTSWSLEQVVPGSLPETKEQPITMETESLAIGLNQEEKVWSPFEFTKTWQALKQDADWTSRGRLLASLQPARLSSVIGNKLDGSMLADLLHCLDKHFDNPRLVLDFLINITRLERFAIISLFLSPGECQVLEKLFVKLEESGEEVPGFVKEAFSM